MPQGSILGPLLFILYVNEISTISLPSSHSLTLYGDDILLVLLNCLTNFLLFNVVLTLYLLTYNLGTFQISFN